jgi:hypothetical protein
MGVCVGIRVKLWNNLRAGFCACIVLPACNDVPLDASSPESFMASLAAIEAPLNEKGRQEIGRAIHDIVLVQAGAYGEGLKVKMLSEKPVDGKVAIPTTVDFMAKAPIFVDKLWSGWSPERRAAVALDWAPAVLDGRTAEDVLRLAEMERKRADAWAKALLVASKGKFEKLLEIAEADLAKAKDAADPEKNPEAAAIAAVLQKFHVVEPKLHYDEDSIISAPILSFDLVNGSTFAIQSFALAITVTTPGRSVPWLKTRVNYNVPGRVEPKEKKHFDLQSDTGDWKKLPEAEASKAVAMATIIAVTDAAGKETGDMTLPDETRKPAFLNDNAKAESIEEKEKLISNLKQRLADIDIEFGKIGEGGGAENPAQPGSASPDPGFQDHAPQEAPSSGTITP